MKRDALSVDYVFLMNISRPMYCQHQQLVRDEFKMSNGHHHGGLHSLEADDPY